MSTPTGTGRAVQTLARVRATIRRHRMLARGDAVVVAVSGGPDSMVLLHLLRRLAGEWRLRLHVVHVEHGLHARSAAHAAFVRATARAWGTPCTVRRVAAATEATRRRVSVEDAARTLRYAALVGVARRLGARRIAVAHTADDQAETVLLWLLRGANPDGLAGMPARRGADGALVVRPLIDLWRHEVLAYAAAERVPFRIDPTNRSRGPLRNRIRQDLLPHLAGYNPGIKPVLRRLAEAAADDAAYLDAQAGTAGRRVVRREHGRVAIDAVRFRRLPVGLQRRVAYRAAVDAGGNIGAVGFVHIERLRAMAIGGRTGERADLPGLRAQRTAGNVVLSRARRQSQGIA
jgi:tRNA(Ile)-lysidine synthase